MQSNSASDASSASAHVQGVNATGGGLVKATLGATVVAGAILTFVWLPAEHGIDPTGVGHLIGLTEMGHIKEQLHADADADAAAAAKAEAQEKVEAAAEVNAANTVSAVAMTNNQQAESNAQILKQLNEIQLQLDAITATVDSTAQVVSVQSSAQAEAAVDSVNVWLDEFEYTLESGEGIEVKLKMTKDAVAEFEWSANGAVLNHDTHGDGNGESISYEKGRSVAEQAGQLVAAFDGNHGWYWRNRTGVDVVVSLRTRGDYSGMVLPDTDY